MKRTALFPMLLLSCAVACSRQMESKGLGLQYEPPPGMALREEVGGPPAVARFEGGLEVRAVEGTPLSLDAPVEAVLGAAGVQVPGRPLNSTQGTLSAGPVARYEFQQDSSRTLVYFLPRAERFLLVLYSAPERDYGADSARVERSLSTLKLTR
ncbi:hypothetical protein P2318_19995 [Myxococcaceae bacterium GXIMD 01537]